MREQIRQNVHQAIIDELKKPHSSSIGTPTSKLEVETRRFVAECAHDLRRAVRKANRELFFARILGPVKTLKGDNFCLPLTTKVYNGALQHSIYLGLTKRGVVVCTDKLVSDDGPVVRYSTVTNHKWLLRLNDMMDLVWMGHVYSCDFRSKFRECISGLVNPAATAA
jgi:hypothetical protein